jgi:hypothetical protein
LGPNLLCPPGTRDCVWWSSKRSRTSLQQRTPGHGDEHRRSVVRIAALGEADRGPLPRTRRGWSEERQPPQCGCALRCKAASPVVADHKPLGTAMSAAPCDTRVVADFSLWQPLEPITGTVTSQTTEVHGDRLVHSLCLPIHLRVESGAHAQLHPRVSKQIPPHVAGKHWVMITDNGLRNAMETHDLLEEGAHHRRSRVGVTQRDEVGKLGNLSTTVSKTLLPCTFRRASMKSREMSAQMREGTDRGCS